MTLRSAPRHSVAIGWMLAALLAGCPHSPERAPRETAIVPSGGAVPAQTSVAHSADADQSRKPAPPKSDPLPPQRLVEPLQVDRSCKADADCVIKDIGSCCGAFPSCVNRDSAADPAAMKAECEKNDQTAHCSRRVIEQCACRQGQCVAAAKTPVGGWVNAPLPPDSTH